MSGWRPALTGRAARLARHIAEEIRSREIDTLRVERSTALDGDAASALFSAYYEGLFAVREHRTAALLDRILSRWQDLRSRPHLFSGAIGATMVVEHLTNHRLEQSADMIREAPYPSGAPYDLAFGAAGRLLLGISGDTSAHRRLGDAAFTKLLRAVDSHGVPEVVLRRDSGRQHRGVAHGAAGILVATAQYGLREHKPQAADLSSALLRYIEDDWYRSIVDRNVERTHAWCTGDVGIACALITAGQSGIVGADELGLVIASSTVEAGIRYESPPGCSLCHGAAGVALAYHRLWNATASQRLRAAAVEYYERLLSSWHYDPVRHADGLLVGAPGVGLVLLSAISDLEPVWDCMLAGSTAAA